MTRSLEFRVLGPLEVLVDGRALVVGRGKQRSLLALLVLNANRVVSTDRLVDQLWGERPPETVHTALQVYVSRLRKELPPDVVLTRAPGYVLRAEPDQLDLARFERLSAEGREELASGRPATAARLLHHGLSLWRGPPLADVAYEPFAQPEVVRLEELRLAALEDRIEADLALGGHAELVGELEALVTGHPLRERPRGQLMLALYRSGRQAEALEEYRRARHALVEDLGIEPSAALQDLEKAILRQDAALAAPPRAVREPYRPAMPTAEPPPTERKLVTILFADLGLEAGPDADPEHLADLFDRVYDVATEELEAAGGAVERGVADAVLAVFGAPAAQEDHAERALSAALALRERLGALFGGSLALRVAVETGDVLLGRPGALASGAPVAAAGRLLRGGGPGEILVGERAASAVEGTFELTGHRRLLVRRLTGARPRGVRGLGAVFVGREDDLSLLTSTYERVVREREPRLVAVLGEAGVGKTTLVHQLRDRLADDSVRWYAGRCLAYGRAITYRPLAEVLRALVGAREHDDAEDALPALAGREILGLTLGLDVAGALHPREAHDRLHDAWIELLDEAAAKSPLVVVVEDLHWAEEPLLDLLERVARRAHGPLLVVATARPELLDRMSAWGSGRGTATRVWLEPLSQADTERMLEELGGGLPEAARHVVLDRAEGNPFFVEELLQTLIDRGLLRRENGGWQVGDIPPDLAVPDSVTGVITARIDLLSPPQKAALQAAAVIGRAFWEGPLRELLGVDEPDLALLEERDFMRRRGDSSLAGEREYVFKHALTREVAYSSLPSARRARLHAAFAEWLERRGAPDENAALLAHHYAEAVRPDAIELAWRAEPERTGDLRTRAVEWLRHAAQLAAGRYELRDALALLDQALAIEPVDRTRIALLREAGYIHMLGYEPEGFRRRMDEALALSPDRETSAEIYADLAHWGHGRPYMWKTPPPPEVGDEWLARALELAAPKSHARGRALVASALAAPEQGAEAVAEGVRIAEDRRDVELLVHACEAYTLVETAAGRYAEACEWADRAIELAPGWPDPDLEGHQFWNAGFVYLRAGRVRPVRRFADAFDRLAARLTPHHEVHAVALHALVESVCGRWDALAQLTARAESATAGNATPCQFNWRSLIVCALGLANIGDERESRRLEEAGRATAVPAGPAEREPALLRLALLHGDLEEAARLLETPVAVDPFGLDLPAARLDVLVALGDRERVDEEAQPFLEKESYTQAFALRALGIVRGRRGLVEEAAARFDAMGLAWRAAETRARRSPAPAKR